MHIEVEGLENVIQMLQQNAVEAAGKVSKGIGEGCKIVEKEAKALCPVSTEKTRPGGPHGELRDSITTRVDGLEGSVFTTKEYANYPEFGTYKMKAKPYMVPALKNKRAEVIQAVAEQFKR